MNSKAVVLARFEEISFYLSNTMIDWSVRAEALNFMKEAISDPILQKTAFDYFNTFGEKMAIQHSDLRSAIVKISSELISDAVRVSLQYKNITLSRFINEFLLNNLFIKALGSGNKVIGKHCQTSLNSITKLQSLKFSVIKKFTNLTLSHKNPIIRERLAEFIVCYLSQKELPVNQSTVILFDNIKSISENNRIVRSLMNLEQNKNLDSLKKINSVGSVLVKSAKKQFFQDSRKEDIFDDQELSTSQETLSVSFLEHILEKTIKDSSQQVRSNAKVIREFLSKHKITGTLDQLPDTISLNSEKTAEEKINVKKTSDENQDSDLVFDSLYFSKTPSKNLEHSYDELIIE